MRSAGAWNECNVRVLLLFFRNVYDQMFPNWNFEHNEIWIFPGILKAQILLQKPSSIFGDLIFIICDTLNCMSIQFDTARNLSLREMTAAYHVTLRVIIGHGGVPRVPWWRHGVGTLGITAVCEGNPLSQNAFNAELLRLMFYLQAVGQGACCR